MATYVSRAYDIGRRYNLTADEMFADALTRAADADAQLASDPTSVGALHGIPISVKDHIAIASHVSDPKAVVDLVGKPLTVCFNDKQPFADGPM